MMITTTTCFGLFLPMIDGIKLNDRFVVCEESYEDEDASKYSADDGSMPLTICMDDTTDMHLDENNANASDDMLMHAFVFYFADRRPDAFHAAYDGFDELKAECRDALLACGNDEETVARLLGADIFGKTASTYGLAESGTLTIVD
jgi:hypothetical protein